ncbi:putative nucleotidyltransferase with HDIG domain [Rhodanobacter sp. K2T2]|uniref:HD-GYP domain-containing protein n=1 Tax=Rhodanobacter sp. K2T2 TaxID=2723085 RepID=UPI0015C6AFA6|nr:HD-GYP domain-containing protein [Rhodanobacter sp. K2T2]NYE27080.1 putative nucleotidyltransferase with HDIG domain [Rhodanobacter sp. K2T2]
MVSECLFLRLSVSIDADEVWSFGGAPMLKKIKFEQLIPGMYVGRMEGSWLKNPFWRPRFLIRSSEEVQALRTAGLKGIWIDTARGLDVAEPAHADRPREAVQPSTTVAAADPGRRESSSLPMPFERELEEASKVCLHAKDVVADIFSNARITETVDMRTATQIVSDMSLTLTRHPSALLSVARMRSVDDYTYVHSVAVACLMMAFARGVGFDEEQIGRCGMAGLLHDLGKARISLEILNKPAELSEAEWIYMREHPAMGYEMLHSQDATDAGVLDACLRHHEKFDGSGYPDRMKGEDIPMLARMVSICDVYDAVTSDRIYKKGWDPADALHRMAGWTGHFDPVLFKAFVRTIGVYPIGSLVRLASQRLAIVIKRPQLASASAVNPCLRVVYSIRTRSYAHGITLDLAQNDCDDHIVAREDRAAWAHLDMDAFIS